MSTPGAASERFAIPGAAGILRRRGEDGTRILVQERDKAGAPAETGLLEIPAGKVRAFESVYDCLRREVREETGLEVLRIEGEDSAVRVVLNGYEVLSYEPFASAQNLAGDYPIMVQTFLCEVAGTELLRSDEARNLRWAPLEELRALLDAAPERFYPMHLATLRRLVREPD